MKNVESAFKSLGVKPVAEKCPGFEGLKKEHDELTGEAVASLVDAIDTGALAQQYPKDTALNHRAEQPGFVAGLGGTHEGETRWTHEQEVLMLAFTVFGAPEWLSVIIVVGIVAATIYFVRRAI